MYCNINIILSQKNISIYIIATGFLAFVLFTTTLKWKKKLHMYIIVWTKKDFSEMHKKNWEKLSANIITEAFHDQSLLRT